MSLISTGSISLDSTYKKSTEQFLMPYSFFLCSQNQAGSDLSKFEEDSDGEEHYEDVKDEDVKDEDVNDEDVKDEDEDCEEDSKKDKNNTSTEVKSQQQRQCCGSMKFWLRIRIRGSIPLTNGSGCRFGCFYFRQ
jgi:hypothetical protein